ncbi:hypothetical protein K7X08_025213 [Anisodus acutangulus]|uniref:Uncharacterized protein n=1 Tax=Anisodus acutangulus TaxID=402998 RepID=A0A9Q1M9B2_9SOLA|nr:hypothetical protein K7X08_025213 [Anisodus acutangulus]
MQMLSPMERWIKVILMVADLNNVNNEPNALRVSSSPDIMETQKPVEITSSAKEQENQVAEDEVPYVPSSLPVDKCYLYSHIQSFINALPEYPLHSHGLINAPKVLVDVVESTIRAVFIDRNSSIDTTFEFEEVLNHPDSDEDLCKLVDPRLGDDYPLDSVPKMGQLAKLAPMKIPNKTKYAIDSGCIDDTLFIDRRLGCWIFLWKSRSDKSYVWKVLNQDLAPMRN